MFSGLFWSGQQAVDLGLADSLGSLDGVAREVVKAPDVIDYTQRENVAERLVKRFGAGRRRGLVSAPCAAGGHCAEPLSAFGALRPDGVNRGRVTIRAFEALFPLRHTVALDAG